MNEKILAYIQTKQAPVSAQELVSQVLHIRQANETTSRNMILALLQSDPRFHFDGTRVTVALNRHEPSMLSDSLEDTEWGIVHLLATAHRQGTRNLGAATVVRARRTGGRQTRCLWTIECRQQASQEFGLLAEEHTEASSDRTGWGEWLGMLEGAVWVSFDPRTDLDLLNRQLAGIGRPALDPPALDLRALAKKLFPAETIRTLEDAAACVGLPWSEVKVPTLSGRLAAEVHFHFLDLVLEQGIQSRADLLTFLQSKPERIEWSRFRFDGLDLAKIPKHPGVYYFVDQHDKVIYVGKAKNLSSRVRSYFQFTGAEEEKKSALRQSASYLTYQETGSELEALLMEAGAIQTCRPAINLQMDIHEQESYSASYGNAILILPSAKEGSVQLYLAGQNLALQSNLVARDLSNLERAAKRIRRFFFTGKKRRRGKDAWKTEILWRWLRKNRDQALMIDVDQVAGEAECLRLLRRYLQEPMTSEKVIHR